MSAGIRVAGSSVSCGFEAYWPETCFIAVPGGGITTQCDQKPTDYGNRTREYSHTSRDQGYSAAGMLHRHGRYYEMQSRFPAGTGSAVHVRHGLSDVAIAGQ